MRKPSKPFLIALVALVAIAAALIVPTTAMSTTVLVRLVESSDPLAAGNCRAGTVCVDEEHSYDGGSTWSSWRSCCVDSSYVGGYGVTCRIASRFDGPI